MKNRGFRGQIYKMGDGSRLTDIGIYVEGGAEKGQNKRKDEKKIVDRGWVEAEGTS